MSAADKIAEANGPERIWAHGNCMGRLGRPLLPGVSSHWATWETRTGDPNHATEYVRADLADAQAQDGWLYHCPDSGLEWSEDHPHESGQCTDATDVRPATVENLKATLLDSWEAWAEDRERADAQAQEIERLRKVLGFYANPENWKGDEEAWERAENGDDDPETLEALLSTVELDGGKIARAALGETP